VQPKHVQRYITELLRATKHLTAYADKRVAHPDLQGPQTIPGFQDCACRPKVNTQIGPS
jgi:hypothetical protein